MSAVSAKSCLQKNCHNFVAKITRCSRSQRWTQIQKIFIMPACELEPAKSAEAEITPVCDSSVKRL
jgi:hypothetical protein